MKSALPRDRGGRFVNWARTESSLPSSWARPATEREVVEAVERARATFHRRILGE